MFFESWVDIGRTAATSILFYVFIIISVRIGGKRATSKMNNYDWIVTVALGSIAGSTILFKDVTIGDGVVASGVLIGLQYIITKLSVRFERVRQLVQSTPRLLLYNGSFLKEAMVRERVTESEIRAAVREKGIPDIAKVRAVVLEADAELSVIGEEDGQVLRILTGVEGAPKEATL